MTVEWMMIIMVVLIVCLSLGVWRLIHMRDWQKHLASMNWQVAEDRLERLTIISREYRVLVEEQRVALGREEKLQEALRHAGQLDNEHSGALHDLRVEHSVCQDTIEGQSISIGIHQDTIADLKARVKVLETEIVGDR